MTEMLDKDIIDRVNDGDAEAFEELVRRYEKTVFNIALRMVGDRDDAADMTQEAFIKAYGSLGSFHGNSRFSVWLYRITTNVCLDHLRAKARKKQVPLGLANDAEQELDIPDMREMPEEQLMRKLSMQAVQRGLERLAPEHRQILIMRELGGISYAEISSALSLEEGTVKSRIFRARKNLCAFLLADGNIPDSIASKNRKGGDR